MKNKSFKVAGIGEVLWDIFPDFRRPGGAPANVAYHAAQLGDNGIVLSRIGQDERGKELAACLHNKGIETGYLQTDTSHPTGTVEVTFQKEEPSYTITPNVAWDFMEPTNKWTSLASQLDAVCFGTLAQRSAPSRKAITLLLDQVSSKALRVLDVNIRPPYYSKDILKTSIQVSNVIKINRHEFDLLSGIYDTYNLLDWLLTEMDVEIICLTKGSEGSELITKNNHYHEKPRTVNTQKGDAVGVGDAFTAALIHYLLRQNNLQQVLEKANHYAGLIVTKKGAMPELSDDELAQFH